MKHCTNCGNELENDSCFCLNCGSKQDKENKENPAINNKESARGINDIKKFFNESISTIIIFAFVAIIYFFISFIVILNNSGKNGDRILIINVIYGNETVSEERVIREALQKGGGLSLNVDVLRRIDINFDSKYTVAGSDNKFIVLPAILNFVGDRGWTLLGNSLSLSGESYIFVKKR